MGSISRPILELFIACVYINLFLQDNHLVSISKLQNLINYIAKNLDASES